MFSRISTLRVLSVLLIVIMLAGVSPFYATPATAQAAEAPSLLSFTSGGHALGFSPQGMYAATGSHALRVDFMNANNVQPQADATTSTDGKSASLGRVAYADLWEGISLEYTTTADSIYTTTYSLAPGADAKNIRLRYNAPLTLNQNGTLNIAFETGTLTESAPIAWQNIKGKRVSVDVSFRVRGQEVAFALGKYDPRHALTIDPSLTWNTFLGESADDWGRAIAVDGSGNVYVAGNSYAAWGCSPTACTVLPYQVGDRDGFVAKLDLSGNLLWNTFLGGLGTDAANGIALDGSGNIYVVGDSTAFWSCPLPYCTVQNYYWDVDAYAAKLDSSGVLIWNTFMGDIYTDYGTAIAVNTDGSVIWVAGDITRLLNFIFEFDAFAFKLNSSGQWSVGSTLGSDSQNDFANAIALDGSGNVYVAGDSNATWGSPKRDHYGAGNTDAFAAKLDSSANLLWNTFLGGSGTDHGYGIAVDGNGNIYIAGESDTAWSCPYVGGCTVQDHHGGIDAFAAKTDSSGYLDWNTFLGESGNDSGRGIAVGGGNVYVTGYSYTLGNPVYAPAAPINPTNDAFATQLSSSGALMANTYLGGSNGQDFGNHILVRGGDVYVVGDSTASWGSPTKRTYKAGFDAFVAKVDFTQSIIFRSVGANDGWVLESGENSNAGGALNTTATTFVLGDNTARKQYRGVLSFTTGASLPDNAVITKVMLKVMKQGIIGGGNPVTMFQGFMVDIRKGFFYSTIGLQAADFQAAASKSYGPFMTIPVSNWYTINLTSGKAYINKLATSGGLTQIRLRFKLDDNNNAIANYLSLYSGNAPAASRPLLMIEYYIP